MTTTSFSESLKYGGRLFAASLLVFLAGGGLFALGAYLAVPELLSYRASGSVETGPVAGGLALAVVGAATLASGSFALVYKLIADAVSRGTGQSPEVAGTDAEGSSTADGRAEVAPTESSAAGEQSGAGEPSAAGDSSVAGGPESTGASATPEEPPAVGTASSIADDGRGEEYGPDQAAEGEPTGAPDSRDGESTAGEGTHREQTAEEIAFGTGGSSETAEDTGPSSAPADEEQADRAESTTGGTETAGTGSSDPLAEQFDEE